MNRPTHGAAGALAAAVAVLALGAAFVMLPGCATNPVTGQKQFSLVSSQQELSIGKEGYPNTDPAESLLSIQAIHHGNDHRTQICSTLGALGEEVPELDGWSYWATGR